MGRRDATSGGPSIVRGLRLSCVPPWPDLSAESVSGRCPLHASAPVPSRVQNTSPRHLQGDTGKWPEIDFDTDIHCRSHAEPLQTVVRTTQGSNIKVGGDSYYDPAGTSGRLQLRWKKR